MSNSQLSGLIIFLSCQNLPFLRFFLKASKMIFDQKNEGFPLFHFTPVEEIFVVLKPYEKDREKQCFLILSSFSHNLTRKLIFSQKEWVRHQIWFAFCCWCIKMLFLMLSNYTFDALLHGQSIQSVEIRKTIQLSRSEIIQISMFNSSFLFLFFTFKTCFLGTS